MQQASLVEIDPLLAARPVVATMTEYSDRTIVMAHYHRRHQLLYGSNGVVTVTTPNRAWVMPPQRGIWIPAGTVHEVRMLGDVKKLNLYIEPDSIRGMPNHCQVVAVPKLMGESAHRSDSTPCGL